MKIRVLVNLVDIINYTGKKHILEAKHHADANDKKSKGLQDQRIKFVAVAFYIIAFAAMEYTIFRPDREE